MTRLSRIPTEAQPARLAALPKLPVFLDLAGKRAIVAGCTAAAAWKAELLAASGAHVEVYGTESSPEMTELIARGAAAGTIRHWPRAWATDVLDGAAIAIADMPTDEEARAFSTAAISSGVPVNVIDKPEYCQFQLGSIVNRSPIVVAISTDGAAPVLAQAIRRRIETLLPPSLADWGRLAKRLRSRVCEVLTFGPGRRAFWERFADRAFGLTPSAGDEKAARDLIDDIAAGGQAANGSVTLVGAGPGDPELLTLKAVRALQAADVILFDDLVSDAVLELARREAKRMMVGKRGRRESCSQQVINDLMLKLALQGKHVVRLKAGDPMIFGRAGEEIAALERAGIQVEVVPGITSASAMAAALKTSLTHRDCAHSVRFVTGHAKNGELPSDLDWRGIADTKTTLVIYMGGRTAPAIAARLQAEGLDPSTPAVAVASVSRDVERTWTGTLDRLADGVGSISDGSPILLGIGEAFRAADDRRQAMPRGYDSSVASASKDVA